MTILFLAPQPFYRLRGVCLAHRRALEVLSRLGARIELLTLPFGSDVEIPGVRLRRLPRVPGIDDVPIGPSWRKAAMDSLLFLHAGWTLWRRRHEVVHASEEAALLAAALSLFFRFRFVYDMDDILSARVRSSSFLRGGLALRCLERLERWALGRADLVLTNSPDTTAYARRYARRVRCYDHLPPLTVPGPNQQEAAARLRRERGLDGSELVLYAGNLEVYQGVGLLVQSLPGVFSRRPRAVCFVIGGEDGQVAQLAAEGARLGLGSRLRCLGKLPIEESLRFMRAADVLVLPGVDPDKAVPMKLYSYLASGAPVVATNLANHARFLARGNARLVEPRAEALAEGICETLEEPRGAGPAEPRSLPWEADADARALEESYAEFYALDRPCAPALEEAGGGYASADAAPAARA
ncbi:MAG: glycosyltransferase [Elusimicrobia bacterium]|nr:glycosyltransferase [Elusimicrobiota bacterium]